LLFGTLAILLALIVLIYPRPRGPEDSAAPAYWPTQGWRTSTPEEQGIDSAKLADALLTIRGKNIQVHSLLLIRNGYAVVDAYFYPYDGVRVHDLASVTKSVTTTLIGIAADQGKLRLDKPMLSFFSDRPIANRDASKERITVRHLVSMTSGLECTRERDEATLKDMVASDDWVQFVLDRKVMWEPGTQFVYCSPGSHLLSAILQQATGMTALEFARHSLFEPLGIRDVIWPADPQGVNRGGGDLRLHPRDAAKLGYLWLSQGRWENSGISSNRRLSKGIWEGKRFASSAGLTKGVWGSRQIVSSSWVVDSVKPQIRSDSDDYYGYGWWVSVARERDDLSSYRADGRGGQYVVVVPSLNIILTTTGGGFALDEIDDLLLPALVDMSKPLPANPTGLARLQAAVRTVAQPPAPKPVGSLPGMATTISGKTFVFEPNPQTIESLRFQFNDSSEALAYIKLSGIGQTQRWPIGLDGVYRMSKGEYDHPLGLRGYWADAQTFVMEYDGITSNDHLTLRMRFEGDRVVVKAQETAHELGATFVGRLRTQ
jgi:CubicO group peptidase (beta-lactamase class C family)